METSIMLQLHTAEELQFFSNLAHIIEGILFLVIAVFAFLNAKGYCKASWCMYIWPSLILVSGLFLPIFSFSHHLNELELAWKAAFTDPQQFQHMIMALVMMATGTTELINVRRKKRSFGSVFPLGLIVIGLLFIFHPQHGTDESVKLATFIHRVLGTVLIAGGLFREASLFWKKQWLNYAWILFIFLAAVLLILYREPEGAYMMH